MRGTCVCLLCMKRDAQRTQNSQFGKGALWKKGVGSDSSVLPLPSQKMRYLWVLALCFRDYLGLC